MVLVPKKGEVYIQADIQTRLSICLRDNLGMVWQMTIAIAIAVAIYCLLLLRSEAHRRPLWSGYGIVVGGVVQGL